MSVEDKKILEDIENLLEKIKENLGKKEKESIKYDIQYGVVTMVINLNNNDADKIKEYKKDETRKIIEREMNIIQERSEGNQYMFMFEKKAVSTMQLNNNTVVDDNSKKKHKKNKKKKGEKIKFLIIFFLFIFIVGYVLVDFLL